MQKGVEQLAKRYCAKVARRLRGWLRDSTITEITLECTHSICSNPELCECDLSQAELWHKIIERFGQPHEYAMRFIDDQGKRVYTRYWFLARNLTIIAMVAVLFSATFSLYLRDILWPSEYQINDPVERAVAIAQLHEVFDSYRMQRQCRMRLTVKSYTYGKTLISRFSLLHRGRNTVLRPINMDVAHIGFTDTMTVIYHPARQAYEKFPGFEARRTLNGNSLLIGLLQNAIIPVQLAVKDQDVVGILVRDTEVTYKISGVYFGWGDASFTVVLNRQTCQITAFAVTCPTTAAVNESCVYSEAVQECDFAGDVSEQSARLKLPANVRQTTNIMRFLLHEGEGWKAMALIDRPAPALTGLDVRTNRQVNIAAYRGRSLLLVCCSTWVYLHRQSLAALSSAYALLRRHGIEVVVLAPDVERQYTVEYLARTPLPFPYLTDFQGWTNPAYARYELFARFDYTPAFIAIDAGGKVVGVSSREFSPTEDSLRDVLMVVAPLLGGEEQKRFSGQLADEFSLATEHELLLRAEEYFTVENDFYGKACLEEILRRQPNNLAARVQLCRLYAEYDWSQSNSMAESCLKDTDESPYPYILLGNYYWRQKNDLDRAVREYGKAHDADPRCYLAWRQEGAMYYLSNRPQEAWQALREAVALCPDDKKSLWLLSQVMADKRDWEDCMPVMRQALSSAWHMRGAGDEQILHLHRMRSAVLNILGRPKQAISELRIALKYDPYYDGTLLSLSRLLLRHGQNGREALEISRRLAEGNQVGEYSLLYGKALLRMGRRQEALEIFREAEELDSTLLELPALLAQVATVDNQAAD